MKKIRNALIIFVLACAVTIIIGASAYTVKPNEAAMIIRLGKI